MSPIAKRIIRLDPAIFKKFVYDRPLHIGAFITTPTFAAIPEHVCVMFDDNQTLVATVGATDDPDQVAESIAYARLFAASPAFLNRIADAIDQLQSHIDRYPLVHATQADLETIKTGLLDAFNQIYKKG